MKRYVVGLGEALWDVLPEGAKLGGAPANFAYHAAQFGFPAVAVSALGRDELGDNTEKAFDEKGLEYIMPRVDFPTGVVNGSSWITSRISPYSSWITFRTLPFST